MKITEKAYILLCKLDVMIKNPSKILGERQDMPIHYWQVALLSDEWLVDLYHFVENYPKDAIS